MRARLAAVLLSITAAPQPAAAQEGGDLGAQEIVVTGSRREADGFDAGQPAIGLRRRADFAIQQVRITGNTRDETKRHGEIYDMVRAAIAQAARSGVQVATGDTVVEPLTLANHRGLTLKKTDQPDSESVSFLVKVPLGAGADARAALDRIDAFVKAVPPVGRARTT